MSSTMTSSSGPPAYLPDGTGKGSHMHAGTEAHKDPPSTDSNPSHGLNFWNPHYDQTGSRPPPSQSSNLPDLGEGKLRKLVATSRYVTALSIAVASTIAVAALATAWRSRSAILLGLGLSALGAVLSAAAVLWRVRAAVSEALGPHWQQYGRLVSRQWEHQAAAATAALLLLSALLTIWQAALRIRSEQKPLYEGTVEVLCGIGTAVFIAFAVVKLALARALEPTTLWTDLCVACAGLAFSCAGIMSTVVRNYHPKLWFTDAAGALAVALGVLAVAVATLARLPWWRARFWVQRYSADETAGLSQLHMHAPSAAGTAGVHPAGSSAWTTTSRPRPAAAIGKWGGDGGPIPPLPQFVQAGVEMHGGRPGAMRVTSEPATSDTFATTFNEQGSDRLHPPPAGASTQERLDFIQQQLDGFGTVLEILEGLRLSGLGPTCRLQGGQSVVQFAVGIANGVEYAIKLFASQSAFLAEADLYRNPTLRAMLPEIRLITDNADGAFRDTRGHPLPPCIVMERGESLDQWSRRARPDRFQTVSVLAHVADRVRQLHAAGYVHRDLKPGNVMWLPRTNRWIIIDFGSVAAVGTTARLSYTLAYAAPEVLRARLAGAATIEVHEALDVWALGVMAFELFTGEPAFQMYNGADAVMREITGGEPLPWEAGRISANDKRRVGIFYGTLLTLLARDASERPSMSGVCSACNRLLSSTTTHEG
eukprot:jgi/Ulvmu1/2306/UM013_0154.1